MTSENFQSLMGQSSSLTIIGVGPGDKSLLTLAAVEAIDKSTLVAFPVSKLDEESNAAKVVSFWISKKNQLPLLFPMVDDAKERKIAWENASKKILFEINNGQKVVFLSLGDSSLFSTASYLLIAIKSKLPELPIEVIPGVNSFSAAAAIFQMPLCMQKEELLILPTPDNSKKLQSLLIEANKQKRVVILLKLGKKWSWVRTLLKELKLLDKTFLAERLGFDDQRVEKAINFQNENLSYFSMLIIRQSWPDVMPIDISELTN